MLVARTFTGDVILRDEFIFGSANVTSSTGSGSGISTITSGNPQFRKSKVGNILKFGGLGKNNKTTTAVNTNVLLSQVLPQFRISRGIFTTRNKFCRGS